MINRCSWKIGCESLGGNRAMRQVRPDSLPDEGVHFIQKPFSMQSLGAKVREALVDFLPALKDEDGLLVFQLPAELAPALVEDGLMNYSTLTIGAVNGFISDCCHSTTKWGI
jgi:hypothetical protein